MKEGDVSREQPATGPKENGDLRLSVAGFELADEFRGHRADDGRKFAIVHLRGRSRLAMEMPAIALREDAAPGETARVGQVFEYKRGELLIRLVTDGIWAFPADPLSEPSATTPMFLPDVTAGFPLAFQVPADATSFRLDCDFPAMKLSTESDLRIPAPIVFPLRGEEPAGPRGALAAADDPPLRVAVLDVREADRFAGRDSGKEERYVVFDVAFRNGAPEGAALDPYERFRLAWGDRNPARADHATKLGPRPAAGPAFLPPGRARAFELVWKVPRDVGKVELLWSGVGQNVSFPFDLGVERERKETLETAPAAAASNGAAPKSAPEPVVPAQREPKGLEGFGIDGAAVNRAIREGREFLWRYVQEEDLKKRGRFGDRREHVLAALALLHARALEEFPDLDGAIRELMATARLGGTYEKSLYLMLVRAYGDPAFYPRAAEVAQSIVNDQGPDGSWSYGTSIPRVRPEEEEEPATADAAPARRDGPFAVTGGEPPEEREEPEAPAFEPHEIERTVPWDEGKDGDNSCSQFAILGLRSAAAFGARAPRRTWERAVASFAGRQGDDGAWGYGSYGAYGSMTCAGLCSLALARDALGEPEPTKGADLRAGLRWLADHFTTARNPGQNEWAYYYVYSVERVGRILDTEFVGPFEWYPMGVRTLLARQGPDGGWIGAGKEQDPRIATSFALLFLTRATEKLRPDPDEASPRPGADRPEEPGRLVTGVESAPDRTYFFVLDCSGSMRGQVDGREKFEIARGALREIVEGLPDGARVALRAYGHRYFAIDEKANEDSELLVPPGPLDRGKFEATLARLRPKGKTPLAFSVAQTARDLRGPTTVILLTDGGEDTIPRGDPVAAAEKLGGRDGVRLRVVGLDIGRPDWTRQLRAMADAAGGTYTPAGDRAELLDVLRASAGGAPSAFTVVDAEGEKVAEGKFGDTVPLPVGRYRLRTTFGGKPVETAFSVSSGQTVRIRWDPEEGR